MANPPNQNPPETRAATLTLAQANRMSVGLTIAVILLATLPYRLLWGNASLDVAAKQMLHWRSLFILIGGILLHEGLHALGWKVFGRLPWAHLHFGVKMLTPYTHCSAPLPLAAYRWGTALPGLLLGVLPLLAGLLLGEGRLLLWGTVFTAAAAGDGMVLWLVRAAPPHALVLDHPSAVGCQLILPTPEETAHDPA